MNQGMLGKAAAILVAAAMVLALAFAFIAEAVTRLACGARPDPENLFAGLVLAVTGNPAGYVAPVGCVLPVTVIRVVDVAAVVLIAGLTVWVLVAVRRYRESDRAFITDLRTRPGFATASEIRDHLSARAVLRRADQLRPDIAKPTATDVGWRVGRSRGQDVYVSIEDSVALEGPPRSGKGYRVLISAILDWSGPLITTSTTNDNLTATMRMRQTRGTVDVFDPQGLSGIRHPLRVSPIAGCEDPLVAMQRGTAIITGTALGASTTNGEWAQASGVVLGRCCTPRPSAARQSPNSTTGAPAPRRPATRSTSSKPTARPAGATASTPPSAATRNSSPPSGSACKAPSPRSPSHRSAPHCSRARVTGCSTRGSSWMPPTRST
jgi:hypothetical protein